MEHMNSHHKESIDLYSTKFSKTKQKIGKLLVLTLMDLI